MTPNGAGENSSSVEKDAGEVVLPAGEPIAQERHTPGRDATGEKLSPEELETQEESTTGRSRPWQRFAFGGPRTGWGTVAAAVLALGVGFAVMTQVNQNEKSGLDNLSQSDLVALLANVNDQSNRLGSELDDLRMSKSKLASGGDQAAVGDAQKRLDEMQILNGTVAVKGPGITITVSQAAKGVTSANALDAVQELRDAGAESIDIDGHRVVASTWFADVDGHAGVQGTALPDSFTITAIGDPHTMSTAMAIPGGVTDTLTQAGAHVKVTETKSASITSTVAESK